MPPIFLFFLVFLDSGSFAHTRCFVKTVAQLLLYAFCAIHFDEVHLLVLFSNQTLPNALWSYPRIPTSPKKERKSKQILTSWARFLLFISSLYQKQLVSSLAFKNDAFVVFTYLKCTTISPSIKVLTNGTTRLLQSRESHWHFANPLFLQSRNRKLSFLLRKSK